MFKAASGAVYRRPKALAGGPRQVLNNLLRDGNTVADYQPGNYTGTLNASAWANSIGAAGPLLQATGANQPIILSSDYVKKAYLPAVAGNTFTSPNLTVTGNRTFTFNVALNDYTPAADVTLFSKTTGNNGFSILWLTTDKVRIIIGDGATLTNVDVVAASSFTDATQHTVSIVWQDGVGATFFYDGVQSGAQVAAAKTLANASVVMTIGSTTSIGKIFSFGVSGLYGFDANDWSETSTNGATQASSTTGEVWTLNNTGAKLAQIVATPQLLFDGAAHFMQATFTLAQPETVYFVGNQVTWTITDRIWDGLTQDTGAFYQAGSSPSLNIYAGTNVGPLGTWAVNTFGVVRAIYNGASSGVGLNSTALVTGNAGAANMGGFTLGANGGVQSLFGNLQCKEVIIRAAADSAATQAQIQSLLKALHSTP